jgi:hypothetical protein
MRYFIFFVRKLRGNLTTYWSASGGQSGSVKRARSAEDCAEWLKAATSGDAVR